MSHKMKKLSEREADDLAAMSRPIVSLMAEMSPNEAANVLTYAVTALFMCADTGGKPKLELFDSWAASVRNSIADSERLNRETMQ